MHHKNTEQTTSFSTAVIGAPNASHSIRRAVGRAEGLRVAPRRLRPAERQRERERERDRPHAARGVGGSNPYTLALAKENRETDRREERVACRSISKPMPPSPLLPCFCCCYLSRPRSGRVSQSARARFQKQAGRSGSAAQ